jgi:hypothetical protein
MLTQLLRLAGIDLEARIVAAKVQVEDKAQHLFGRVKGELGKFALGTGLLLAAGLMALVAGIVALMLLYQAVEPALGPIGALLVVLLVLCGLAAGCLLGGLAVLRRKVEPEHLLFPPPVAVVEVIEADPPHRPTSAESRVGARARVADDLGPMFALLGRFFPLTGNWAIDGAIRHASRHAQGTAREALGKAAHVVECGSRPAMLGVLGGAALVGYLMVRRRR